jgi:hypothetical protein
MAIFGTSDVFAGGAGCDIAGAFLLARGLIASPADILRRSIVGENYFSPAETASQIADKADATIGLAVLVTGFVIQAIGYAIVSAGLADRRGSVAAGIAAAMVAVLVAAAALGVWRLLRWRVARAAIASVASDPLQLDANYVFLDTHFAFTTVAIPASPARRSVWTPPPRWGVRRGVRAAGVRYRGPLGRD